MSKFDIVIQEISRSYPTFLRGSDLIQLGMYPSAAALSFSMKIGSAPPHIRVSSNKILFPRSTLITWLLEKTEKPEEVTQDEMEESLACV